MLSLILAASSAFAWDCWTHVACDPACSIYVNPVGADDEFHYHYFGGDLPAAWVTQIDAAATAWNAGPGELNVGPEWHMIRDADIGNPGINNGRNEIWDEDSTWFVNHGYAADYEVAREIQYDPPGLLNCPKDIVEVDIIFNSSLNWSTSKPSEVSRAVVTHSVGQAAMNVFSLVAGLSGIGALDQHSTTHGADVDHGGDVSKTYRVLEDDFEGLLALRPCSGAGCADGLNLMLSRFAHKLWVNGVETTLADGQEDEVWDLSGDEWADEIWHGAQGATLDNTKSPHPLLAHLTGTESNVATAIRWRLTQNGDCTAPFWPVGEELITLNIGDADPVRLDPFVVPATIPDGQYWLCAIIDPLNVWSETSEVDNNIRSERMFTVD